MICLVARSFMVSAMVRHFLTSLPPVIWIIREHARHRGGNLLRSRELWERAFGSVIGKYEGCPTIGAQVVPSRRKQIEPTDWRFTMEQVGGNSEKFIDNLDGCLGNYARSLRN